MDNFEKHIRDNKALFDEFQADKNKLWTNIESRLGVHKQETKIIRRWNSITFKIAAIVIIALGLFSLINIGFNSTNHEESFASMELNEIDMHYGDLVAYQVKLVKKNTQLSLEEKEAFLLFMEELDEEYDMLKQELQNEIDHERILEAIVINYKKRIELIENLLSQINRSKKIENDDAYIL